MLRISSASRDEPAGGLGGTRGLGLLFALCVGCPGVEPSATGAGGGDGGRHVTSTGGQGGLGEGAGGGTSSGPEVGGHNTGGCDADLSSDKKNCGECGRACLDDDQVAVPMCVGGVCRSSCESGFVNISAPASGPDDGCEAAGRRVFVTEEPTTASQLGGVSGADDRCQQLADTQTLGGQWLAWLSDGANSSSPALRFDTEPDAPYMLLDFTVVADSWEALVSEELLHAIDLSETSTTITTPPLAVWTGTSPLGASTASHCNGWSNADGQATVGSAAHVTEAWTQQEQSASCAETARLYCFEQ